MSRRAKLRGVCPLVLWKDLASLSTLLSMQSNYAQYRRALDDCKNKLHIPIMGVHLKDLIAASVGLDYEKSGRISKKKLIQLASTFSHFMLFTHASSTRNQLPEPNVDLINTLKVSLDIRYNDDDMYQLSLRREPRTLLTFEPSSKSIVFADWASGVSSIPDRETVEKHIAAMVDAVFKHYDHDNDNYITQSEFRQIAGNFPFIDPFGTIDVDRDGQISRVEMNEYFMRMNKSSDFRAEFKHNFLESSFIAPTTCGNCTKVLWGFFRHGYRCTDCGLAVHDSCRDNVVAECRRKSSDKGSIDSRSDNGKDSSRGISDWFSARNSYNASFRKLLGSVRSGRYRTSSTMSQSPEPPPRSPLECSKSARECSSFRLRLSRTSTPTRTASESAACCYKTPSGECIPTNLFPFWPVLFALPFATINLFLTAYSGTLSPLIFAGIPSFDHWSPEDLSNSLTHIDFKILSRITIGELKKYVREGKLREAPVLERSITVFNNLSNWVQCMVLSKATPQERAEIVTKFVKVGKCLKKQHNYNTLMAVIGGVTHSNIARLGKTHAILASEIKKDLASLSTLLSMQSNYAQYRRALDDCKNKLHIPIMGVHLKDLIAASVGLDYEKSGRISKKKLLQLASTFSHFILFTHASSTRNQLPEPNVDLINTLKVSLDIRYNDDDMYQLSLRREPRTLLTFEPSSKSIVFADWASGVSSIPDRETVEKHIAAMVDAVFKHYDHDKDNYISHSEFRQIAGNFPFIDPFGTIDVDRDGQISRVEMNEYFMRMNKSSDFRAEFKHNFLESSFIAPTTCGNCTKVLWGFFRHGYRCTDCGLAVHDSCRDNVVAECRRKSSDKGSIDSRSDNGKDSSRGISDWFSARNSYNASFRKLLGSVRSGRYRTSSTMSQSPEPPPRSPLDCSKSAMECSSFRLRLSRTSTPTRTASESAACCYKTPSGECETPPPSATLASLACEEVFDEDSASHD